MSEREMDIELERVVNAPRSTQPETTESWAESFHVERYNNRRTRFGAKAIYSFFGAAAFLGLYFADLLIGWISIPAFVLFACTFSGSVGHLREMNRR